jgi:8-oxo-dGTP pyrophosphatase MutT (NUDIX family)
MTVTHLSGPLPAACFTPRPVLAAGDRQRLLDRTRQAPPADRVPLWLGEHRIGSLAPALAARLAQGAASDAPPGLALRAGAAPGWQLQGEPTAALASLGDALRASGLVNGWREERLPVLDEQGAVLAAFPRGAARLLGIATHSVHLVGCVALPAGPAVWVQQRATDKAEDPGRWDTLMGGTLAWGETVQTTLARETGEEAGLALSQLQGLAACGTLRVQRPGADAAGLGWHTEHIHCFGAWLAPDLAPVNTDGEVAGFERLDGTTLSQWLAQDRFTAEAAGVLLQVLAPV